MKKDIIAKFGVGVTTALMLANAHATVTMTLASGYFAAENSGAFDATLGGTPIIASDDLIGIYSFNISAGSVPNLASPFYATCISPAGLLDGATHTYDTLSFADAEPGLNPPGVGGSTGWAGATPALGGGYGIQNANYLYSLLSPGIISSPNADQGAAMALAMYTVLYNSTAYCVYSASGPFQLSGGVSALGSVGNVLADYKTDLQDLNGFTASPPAVGYVLKPNPTFSGAGQDMILLASGNPSGYTTPVPEPTTIISGALLLLPFGASTLRVLRRNRLV
jgi:hypothetical protein